MYNFANLIYGHALTVDTALLTNDLQPVPQFTLTLGNLNPVRVRYRSPLGFYDLGPDWSRAFPHEVTLDLFVRDPEEYHLALNLLAMQMPDQWPAEMAAKRSYPAGETSWLPANGPWQPHTVQEGYLGDYTKGEYKDWTSIDPHYFWGFQNGLQTDGPSPIRIKTPFLGPNHLTWASPGADPNSWGSIKTIRAASHSICESEVPIQDILNSIKMEFPRRLHDACGTNPFPTVRIDASDLLTLSSSSFLRKTQPSSRISHFIGGFSLWGEVHTDVTSVIIGPHGSCTADFLWDYTFLLQDGFVVVSEAGLGGSPVALPGGDAGICASLTSTLAGALGIDIPNAIAARARGLARRPNYGACELGDTNPLTGVPFRNCHKAAGDLKTRVAFGLAKLYPSGAPAQLVADANTAIDDGANDADGTRNWDCVPGPNAPNTCHGELQCDFLLRAKSLVYNPDTLDLVWFDSINDVWPNAPTHNGSYPGIVTFLEAFAGGKVDEFCNRPIAAGNSIARHYATFHQSALTCKDERTVRPPDKCCVTDHDCASFPHAACDKKRGRCDGADCNASNHSAECFAFEHCVGNIMTGLFGCAPYSAKSCDARDPFAGCPKGSICENGECRQR